MTTCGTIRFSRRDAGLAQWPRSCMSLKVWSNWAGLLGNLNFEKLAVQSYLQASKASGISFRAHLVLAESDIEIRTERMAGSTLAYAYFPSNTCNERLQMRFNNLVNWNDPLFIETLVHELGHSSGLEHEANSDDIMFWQVKLGRTYAGHYHPKGSGLQLIQRYGESKPEPEPEPEPVPVPVPQPPEEPNMPWGDIIQVVLDLIAKCKAEGRGRSEILSHLQAPGPMAQFYLSRDLRLRLNKTRREWRDEGPAIMSTVLTKGASLTQEELEELISESSG